MVAVKAKSAKVKSFVESSKRYVKDRVAKANKDGNAYLTKAEAKKLPVDLRDNFENHRLLGQENGRVSVKKFTENFSKYVALKANEADKNGDGILTATEANRLARDLKDNFSNFLISVGTAQDTSEFTSAVRTSATALAGAVMSFRLNELDYYDLGDEALVRSDRRRFVADFKAANLKTVPTADQNEIKRQLPVGFRAQDMREVALTDGGRAVVVFDRLAQLRAVALGDSQEFYTVQML